MPAFNGKNLVPLKLHDATESYYFFQEVSKQLEKKAQLSSSVATYQTADLTSLQLLY